MIQTFRSKFFPAALVSTLLFSLVRNADGQITNLSDLAISNVIVRIATHWQRTLADGSYPAVTTLSAAQAATAPTGITWEYAWGVNLYGQFRVKDATGNTNAENFALNHNLICARYYAWLMSLTNTLTDTSGLANFQNNNAVLGQFFKLGKLDYCGSMSAQMLEGALRHASGPTIEQVQMAMITANYITSGQGRTNGTLYRPERSATIWADDLYMSCPFLIRWYQYTGNTNFLDDAARQVVGMAGYLQDTNGLWFHGYYCTNHYVNGVKWGRGNGWAMVATAEVLSVMPTNHPARTNLLSILRRHIAGVEAVQATDGMWHQVLDHPEVWEETSCTALYAYSIARAVNRGWIDPTNLAVARKAFSAIAQLQVSASGAVSNICPGTSLTTDFNYYKNEVPSVDERHGPGAIMLAGAEILLSPKLGIARNGTSAAISWNAGLTNYNLQATTNLADWNIWTNPPAITNWQNVVTDSNAPCRFFRLSALPMVYPPAALNFEAESLARMTNGATATVSALDANASGGYYVTLNGDGTGDYIEFTLTNVPAGAYRLKLAFRSGSNRGQLGLKLDGNSLGGTLDEYWPLAVYPLRDFGPVTFASTGDHTVRLTVAGKNVASSSYTIAADKFLLVPQ
jgi:unsaturated rhamnogalacturonyl hydrolase